MCTNRTFPTNSQEWFVAAALCACTHGHLGNDLPLAFYCSGYYRRYLPKFVYVKSVIESGTIGRITSVNLRLSQSRHKFEGEEVRADWRVEASHAGGGLFMDLGYGTDNASVLVLFTDLQCRWRKVYNASSVLARTITSARLRYCRRCCFCCCASVPRKRSVAR